jgi:hypothetical protein
MGALPRPREPYAALTEAPQRAVRPGGADGALPKPQESYDALTAVGFAGDAEAGKARRLAPGGRQYRRRRQQPFDGSRVGELTCSKAGSSRNGASACPRSPASAIETADILVHEVLSRNMRDRRAVARLRASPAPDESGRKRRVKGQCTTDGGYAARRAPLSLRPVHGWSIDRASSRVSSATLNAIA